jgi:hypothetical protein
MFGFGAGVKTALDAAKTAGSTGAGYGADASTVNSQLLPFLTRELNNPMGYSQQQKGAMLNSAEAGAGGATAGINTEANLASARSRNSGGFSGALDEAAREKAKVLSANASGIEAKDADLQEEQKQEAAKGLQNLYGTDTSAQLKAMGLIPEDVNSATSAFSATPGWMKGIQDLTSSATNIATLGGGFRIPGFGGFKPKG